MLSMIAPPAARNRNVGCLVAIGAALALSPTPAGAGEKTAAYYTAAQARAGAGFFAVNCSRCHGIRLQGGSAPPLAGARIAGRWPVALLFHFVSREMPADARGSLTPTAYGAIVAFLLQRNGHPAGRRILTAATARAIRERL
jgi:mono/diheme cytochrome c family protein